MFIAFILLLIFGCAVLLTYVIAPILIKKGESFHEKRVARSVSKLEEIFIFAEKKKIYLFIFSAPVIFSVLGWLAFNNIIGLLVGGAFGLIVPSFAINIIKSQRERKFSQQLVDGLMVMSSALKGGLSLIQSFEVLSEEMPPPISEEFSMVLREVKVGIGLEDALEHLNKRMSSEELELFISSILVAKETGGNITKVFSRLISTIRERNQLKEKIATYTIQGKIQGIIMSILPFGFVLWVIKFNPGHFDIMLKTEIGKIMLAVAVVLQIVALFMIKKFSTIKL